jgi:hypothetical protein
MTQKKINRINKYLEKLRNNQDVQLRDIKSVLTARQYSSMEANWSEQIQIRKPEKPQEITRYDQLLSKALLLDGRHEQVSGRVVKSKRLMRDRNEKEKVLGSKADSAFEDALEHLYEILTDDPSLRIWFDRDIGPDSEVDINAGAMPRVVTSRSAENQGDVANFFGHKTRMQIKIEALEMASLEFQNELKTDSQRQFDKQKEQAQGEKLRQMLGKLKDHD